MIQTWLCMLALISILSFQEVVLNPAVARDSRSAEMVASLRRYLMADNSDYDYSQTEELTSPRNNTSRDIRHEENFNNNNYRPRSRNNNKYRQPVSIIKKKLPRSKNNNFKSNRRPIISGINNDFVKTTAELDVDSTASPKEPKVHKNDLLYYIDDTRLTRRKGVPDYDMWSDEFWLGKKVAGGAMLEDKPDYGEEDEKLEAPLGNEELNETILDVVEQEPDTERNPGVTTPKVTYKLLKMKADTKSRRSGRPVYRRFLQEEREDGFSIINLDDQPFPQFRLASARRRHDSDEVPPVPGPAPDRATELVQASDTEPDDEPLTRPP